MMIPCNYEINVARVNENYSYYIAGQKHTVYARLFTANLGDISLNEAKEIFAIMKEKFPAPEYNLTLTYVKCVGQPIEGYDHEREVR